MVLDLSEINYGKLKESEILEKNIVYYRRGLEELSLNLTNRCPNSCKFCIRNKRKGWGEANLYLSEDPSVEEIIQAYDKEYEKIVNAGVNLEKIKICGYGEPILRFNDLQIISKHIRNFNQEDSLKIQVTTTGWPYFRFVNSDPEAILDLKKAGVSDIYLSINALNKSDYNRLVNPGITKIDKEAFTDSLRFGIFAKKAGLNVTFGFIRIGNINEQEVAKFADTYGVSYKLRELE